MGYNHNYQNLFHGYVQHRLEILISIIIFFVLYHRLYGDIRVLKILLVLLDRFVGHLSSLSVIDNPFFRKLCHCSCKGFRLFWLLILDDLLFYPWKHKYEDISLPFSLISIRFKEEHASKLKDIKTKHCNTDYPFDVSS